jgi:transcriptional regulator with XRE-family HTH domain
MPRLLSQRPKTRSSRKLPPCGKIIEYQQPSSPFQKLIETARLKYGYSTRSLAKEVGVNQSTLWIWLHSKNGFPAPKSFKEHHLKSLSQLLHIPELEIRQAIDASRLMYTPGEIPPPAPAIDSFAAFIQILENDKRVRLLRSYVINLAKNLHAGAMAASQTPQPLISAEKPTAKVSRAKKKK